MLQCKMCKFPGTESVKYLLCFHFAPTQGIPVAIFNLCVWCREVGRDLGKSHFTLHLTANHLNYLRWLLFLQETHLSHNGSHSHTLIWPGHWVLPTDNILTDLEGRGGWREEGRMGRRKVSLLELLMSMLTGFLPGRLGAWPPSLSHILCASWRKACGIVYTA